MMTVVVMMVVVVIVTIIAIIICLGYQPDNAGDTGNDDGVLRHGDR
jgi:hypothetical protein